MRYFFTLIGVMIVWRSFAWLRKDRRLKHKRLKQLPDAGTIGILTVEQGSRQLQPGEIIPVPHEGVLGYLRTCDVVVPVDDVATMHLDFTFEDGKGLFIYPRRGCDAVVDGVTLTSRRISQRYPMQHGSVLEIGQAVLRLGVFAGLNVKDAPMSPYMPDESCPEAEIWQPELPDSWQPDPPSPPQQPYQTPVQYPPDQYTRSPYVQPMNQPQTPPADQSWDYWHGGDGDAQ